MTTTTAPQAPVDDQVDTSDLDLFNDDDDLQHNYCIICFPKVKALDVITAACGKRVVVMTGGRPRRRCVRCHLAFLAQFCAVHRVTW